MLKKSKALHQEFPKSMPIDEYFAPLRHLARRVDNEISRMGKEIENIRENGGSIDPDGAYTKNFLQHARKDMKNLKSEARNLHDDLSLRGSTVIEAAELVTSMLDIYSERLESVEKFMENYGYGRPEIMDEESPEASWINEAKEYVADFKTNSEKNSNPSDIPVDEGMKSECENRMPLDVAATPPSSMSNGRRLSPRTPRLEDFGLSDYTLSLFSKNCAQYTPPPSTLPTGSRNTDDNVIHDVRQHLSAVPSETRSFPMVNETTVSSYNLHHNNVIDSTPSCLKENSTPSTLHSKQNEAESSAFPQIRTPRPEDFGLPCQMIAKEHEKISYFRSAAKQNFDSMLNMVSSTQDSPKTPVKVLTPAIHDTAPMLQGLVHTDPSYLRHSLSNSVQGKMDIMGLNLNFDKENLNQPEQSPRTPEMPILETSHWKIPSCVSPVIICPPKSTNSVNYSSDTSELLKLQTCHPTIDENHPPFDVLLQATEVGTPPMPVLMEKRYVNDY